MSGTELFRTVGPTSRVARQVGRQLAQLDGSTDWGLARIKATAELQAGRADAIGAVAGRAMQDVALLSQLEQQLAATVPMASGRLATIADIAALSMAEIVSDTAYRLRRC